MHLQAIGHPLLVDHQYGRAQPSTAADLGLPGGEDLLARTPLHASRIELPALESIRPTAVEAPLPPDMARTLAALRSA